MCSADAEGGRMPVQLAFKAESEGVFAEGEILLRSGVAEPLVSRQAHATVPKSIFYYSILLEISTKTWYNNRATQFNIFV